MTIGNLGRFLASRSKPAGKIEIPDVDSLPPSEKLIAIDNFVAVVNAQRIDFGFRKIDPDARGQETLKSVAKGMSLLSEYVIRLEGHSNLAKSEEKLTAEDQARIQKLSEDRADACARLLKAAGVQNEITCIGHGALKGETKGGVRLLLVKKEIPVDATTTTSQPQQTKGDEASTAVDTLVHDTTVEDTCALQMKQHDVPKEASPPEKTEEPANAESRDSHEKIGVVAEQSKSDAQVVETASRQKASSEDVPQERNDFTILVEPEAEPSKNTPAPVSAPGSDHVVAVEKGNVKAWGSTHLPWYITCCSQKPKVEECPMQGLPVKQMQLLQ